MENLKEMLEEIKDMDLQIEQLIKDGGVIMGPPPTRSPSLQNQPDADKEVKETAKTIWAEVDGANVKHRKFGKGMILSGMTMEEAFELINVAPDCQLPDENTIHYGHRTLKSGSEIYFVSNQTNADTLPSQGESICHHLDELSLLEVESNGFSKNQIHSYHLLIPEKYYLRDDKNVSHPTGVTYHIEKIKSKDAYLQSTIALGSIHVLSNACMLDLDKP